MEDAGRALLGVVFVVFLMIGLGKDRARNPEPVEAGPALVIEWEIFNGGEGRRAVSRLRVHGGWVLRVNHYYGPALVYVPDAKREWLAPEPEKEEGK